ncbi:MAG TPA: YihY/virulence factor BrkB family protein [Anaerolineales bacterium]|nr:YihY/virulence factor BrkB family protein [Anaerolineales bacterium]
MPRIKFVLRLIYDAYNEWSQDRAARIGAALAYYALFSIAPLLVIMITIAGAVYGEAAAEGRIVSAISGQIGPDAAAGVERFIQDVNNTGSRFFSTLVTSIILVYGATNLFSQLRDALNSMWRVRPKPREHFLGGFIELAWDRLLAASMVLSITIVLLTAWAMSTGLTVLNGWLKTLITPDTSFLLEGGNILTGLGLTTLLFAITFKLLPDVKISWRVVWVGAIVTSFLFNIGAFLIGLYLGYGGPRTILGAAGSLVVLMVWIAYSAQIIFFGAKFARVYAEAIGTPILPASNAVSMKLSPTDETTDKS